MEKYCVNIYRAKELKKIGWNKDTEFWWTKENDKFILSDKYEKAILCDDVEIYAAPTVGEILEELTNKQIEKYNDDYHCLPYDIIDLFRSANKLAEVWMYSKDNKYFEE